MSSSEEARLKTYFEQLRDQDQREAPSFAAMVCGGRRPASLIGRVAIAAVLVLAAAIGATVAFRSRSASRIEPAALASWSSPTAFLLETPGRQYLKGAPRFGDLLIYT